MKKDTQDQVAALNKFDERNLTVISADEFKALKAKHKRLYILDLTIEEDETYQYIACRPSRDLLSAVADAKNIAKTNDLILKNMILAGDMEALDDGLVYSRLMTELGKLMKLGQSFLSKA